MKYPYLHQNHPDIPTQKYMLADKNDLRNLQKHFQGQKV